MKFKKGFKRLSIATLTLPMIGLLLFFYITGNKGVELLINSPHLIFPQTEEIEYNYFVDPEDYWSIDEVNGTISFHADLFIYNSLEIEGGKVTIEIPEVFSMGEDYFKINENYELEEFDTAGLVKENTFERSFVIGLNIVYIALTIGIIAFMVTKKMELLMRYRRASVLLTSTVVTLIFLMLSMITEQIYLTFAVFTVSWFFYYIEWIIYRKINGLSLSDERVRKVSVVNE